MKVGDHMNNFFSKKSNWIWTSDWDEQDQSHATFVYFRRTITLTSNPQKTIIQVSADSRYRLYVNGVSVAFGPTKGDDEVWFYEEIDITPYLVLGENVFAAVVLRYPIQHGKGNQSIWRTDMPGFYLTGSISCESGQKMSITSDYLWKTHKCTHISIHPEAKQMNYLWIFENVKGEPSLSGWYKLGFDDEGWGNAQAYLEFNVNKGISPGNLIKRTTPLMFEKERLFEEVFCIRQSSRTKEEWQAFFRESKPIQIEANKHEVIEISAGELTTGFLDIRVAAGRASQIKIVTAESYVYPIENPTEFQPSVRKGNRIDYKNGTLIGYEDDYLVSGYGRISKAEMYEPFWFRTFRFIQLDIQTGDEALVLESFTYRETGYPLEVQTHVETSDSELQSIWDMSLLTLRRCMHETYEDCPFYEQLQYAMDTRSQILFTYSVSADDRLARKAIDDFHRSLRYDGLINCCYPSYEPNIIPGFSLYYILMIYDHMMYFGDKDLVKKYMPTIEAILGFFSRAIDKRGLVGKVGDALFSGQYWSFIDWTSKWNETFGVPSATKKGPITMESFLYVTVLGYAGQMAHFIGRNELANEYNLKAEHMRQAINTHCLSENGYFQDGPGIDDYSQHSQVWAVLSEAIVGEEAKQLMKRTLRDESLAKCSVAMAYYLFRALEKVDLYEEIYQLFEPWRDMLRQNLTTCVEDPVTGRSDCHAWGSLVLYELPAVILGIRPVKPGFAAIKISPMAGYLDWAKGEVITPKGKVTLSWKKKDGLMEVTYQIPDGIETIH